MDLKPKRGFFVPALIAVLANLSMYAQSDSERLLTDIRNGQNIIIQDYSIDDSEADYLVRTFEGELEQFDRAKRYVCYFYLQRLAIGFSDMDSKAKILELLVRAGLNDPDMGNRSATVKLLYMFPPESFNNSIRNTISGYIVSRQEPFVDLVRLGGFGMISQIEGPLVNLVREGSLSGKELWSIHLALGRLGNGGSIQQCMQMIRGAGMNDIAVHSLLPDIIYLNQKEGIDYLLMQILDDSKQCSSPNPDVDIRITCAYRLMEAVAPVIEGFPVETDASGDLSVNDYEEALVTVRSWIHENYHSYELRE